MKSEFKMYKTPFKGKISDFFLFIRDYKKIKITKIL